MIQGPFILNFRQIEKIPSNNFLEKFEYLSNQYIRAISLESVLLMSNKHSVPFFSQKIRQHDNHQIFLSLFNFTSRFQLKYEIIFEKFILTFIFAKLKLVFIQIPVWY